EPPEGKTPDFTVEQTTSVDQTALYRLSGDKNPLHIDPTFANKGGFDRPILHGLCSFGIAGKALVHEICGSDPVKLKSFSVRFMNVAYPGDKLKTVGWKIDDGKYIIRTTNQDGKIILGNAVAETNS
ncbi:MAG: MaoC family dehydratase, partial [Deltaproteobacteria bacterium]|nr:MaoC family dehydratase [Deltaproteobacteria bacterium]